MHVAHPVRGSKTMSNISIISQVNTHSRSPQWLKAFTGEQASQSLGGLHKDDLGTYFHTYLPIYMHCGMDVWFVSDSVVCLCAVHLAA
jgi:hypothetical protein